MITDKREKGNGITNLDSDITLGDLPHIEANCGNHVFAELTGLENTNIQLVSCVCRLLDVSVSVKL